MVRCHRQPPSGGSFYRRRFGVVITTATSNFSAYVLDVPLNIKERYIIHKRKRRLEATSRAVLLLLLLLFGFDFVLFLLLLLFQLQICVCGFVLRDLGYSCLLSQSVHISGGTPTHWRWHFNSPSANCSYTEC